MDSHVVYMSWWLMREYMPVWKKWHKPLVKTFPRNIFFSCCKDINFFSRIQLFKLPRGAKNKANPIRLCNTQLYTRRHVSTMARHTYSSPLSTSKWLKFTFTLVSRSKWLLPQEFCSIKTTSDSVLVSCHRLPYVVRYCGVWRSMYEVSTSKCSLQACKRWLAPVPSIQSYWS